jgi:hypothetical protein
VLSFLQHVHCTVCSTFSLNTAYCTLLSAVWVAVNPSLRYRLLYSPSCNTFTVQSAVPSPSTNCTLRPSVWSLCCTASLTISC